VEAGGQRIELDNLEEVLFPARNLRRRPAHKDDPWARLPETASRLPLTG